VIKTFVNASELLFHARNQVASADTSGNTVEFNIKALGLSEIYVVCVFTKVRTKSKNTNPTLVNIIPFSNKFFGSILLFTFFIFIK
jgi:hypothetical protein